MYECIPADKTFDKLRRSSESTVLMYVLEQKIFIGGTASAVTNNVAVNLTSRHQTPPHGYAVIDRRSVCVIGGTTRPPPDDQRPQHPVVRLDANADVTQVRGYTTLGAEVRWCTLGYINCLVVACTEGLIIYDCDQQYKQIYSHNCEDKIMKEKYAKGIATFDCTYLCVGNSNGTIRVFGPDKDGQVMFLDRKLVHGAPVTDMISNKQNLMSCDESGCTVLSKLDSGELIIVARSKVFGGHPCTTIETTRVGLVAVGYGCGSIRMFDPSVRITDGDAEDKLPVIVQVSAHARCVTSMSAAKEADLLLTVSEDSWIRVWKINSGTVALAFCYMKEDTLFTGCQFTTRNGSKYCTTSYDSPYITCYAINQ